MRQYLDILQQTLNGEPKKPYRNREGQTVTDTVGIFAAIFRHKMSDGFPLLTTKKMPLRIIAVELEGFIKGITDKQWYKDRGCNIWNEWANPTKVEKLYQKKLKEEPLAFELQKEYKKEFAESEDDLGPIYGYQWRKFGQQYGEKQRYEGHYEDWDIYNGIERGYDQLQSIVLSLEKNPTDRRMVCSAWNPNQIAEMALPPCHFAWNVVVYNGKLNLIWHQRSCDVALGVPFNIASYSLLLKLLAKHAGLEEGELVGTLNDCHIYSNHIEGVKKQLNREPYMLPTLNIPNNDGNKFDIFKWDHTQLELVDYKYHPKISFDVTV